MIRKAIIICCLLFGISVAAAYGEGLQPTIQVEVTGKQVRVTGTVLSAGKQVTLLVKNPAGQIEHINQLASSSEAAYSFQFTIADPLKGNYTAYVGSSDLEAPLELSFKLPTDGGQPSQPPASFPVAPSAPRPDLMIVDESLLRTAKDGKIALEVPAGKAGVLLGGKAAEAAGGNQLDIAIGHAMISISPEALQVILEQIEMEQIANMGISLTAAPLSANEAAALMNRASKLSAANIRSEGEIIRLQLAIVDLKTGEEIKTLLLKQPLQITFMLNRNADLTLAGIYRISDKSELEFRKGEAGKEPSSFTTRISDLGLYGVLTYDKSFVDVPPSHWAYQGVKVLSAKHIIKGISDADYAPARQVTRAEMAALLNRTLGLSVQQKAGFADVDPAAWYADDVAALAEAGIIKGVSETIFEPDRMVTREEMAVMLVRAYKVNRSVADESPLEIVFEDQSQISEWAADSVLVAYQLGLIQGNEKKQFHPKSSATRAEMAQVIYNFLKK
ncbi:S-layer homology domain-containing protein [Paenibacillus sp. IITD108]|uniref:S-layer homology domain-containing protein n=1 Tax=Paenibacillus sp. IITD108 TaxID=3116649 RepID=UPI002F424622